ncbi:sodium/glutamate symporter, partial [Clostridioides difficile]
SPKIGIQISDVYPESWTDSYKELYKDVANCPVEWAKYVEANTVVTFQVIFIILFSIFICFRVLGKDFDSAIIISGLIGHGIGATP